jgi:hypothetical protein
MSKGNARVSGTAPTYYTVDALDECPNTPDRPYPVAKLQMIATSVLVGGKKRRRDCDSLGKLTAANHLRSIPRPNWAGVPFFCDTSARIRDEHRTVEPSDDKNMKREGVYHTWAEMAFG